MCVCLLKNYQVFLRLCTEGIPLVTSRYCVILIKWFIKFFTFRQAGQNPLCVVNSNYFTLLCGITVRKTKKYGRSLLQSRKNYCIWCCQVTTCSYPPECFFRRRNFKKISYKFTTAQNNAPLILEYRAQG